MIPARALRNLLGVGVLIACGAGGIRAYARVQRDLLSVVGEPGRPARWTLADWLTDRQGPSLISSFLAFNRNQRLFEVNATATSGSFKLKNPNGALGSHLNENQQTYAVDLYASIFNLHGELERTTRKTERRALAAGLRLIGTGTRTTNLVARYGWQVRRDEGVTPPTEDSRRYAEGQAQIYVFDWLGVDGSYRAYFPRGERHRAGLFVEVWRVRLAGSFEREATGSDIREGFEGGLKFFF